MPDHSLKTHDITDPGDFVTRFIENIEQSHFTAAMEMVSDDCEYDNVPITKVFGKEAMIQILSDFLAAATKVEWLIHHQVSSGDMEHGVVMNERTDRFEMDDRWIELYSRKIEEMIGPRTDRPIVRRTHHVVPIS